MTGARVLVVDDEAAIRDTMRMILEYDGHECLVAGAGQEALTIAERESPDLVFLDIKMPGMDGLEVLGRLRALNETLPVVDDLRARLGLDGARGRPTRRVPVHRETAVQGLGARRGA